MVQVSIGDVAADDDVEPLQTVTARASEHEIDGVDAVMHENGAGAHAATTAEADSATGSITEAYDLVDVVLALAAAGLLCAAVCLLHSVQHRVRALFFGKSRTN